MPPYIEAFLNPVRDSTSQIAIVLVLLLILTDFLFGIIGAIATKTFSSEIMRNGLVHKFTELVCIWLGIVLDGAFTANLDLTVQPVLLGTCLYLAAMETGSILELVKQYNPDAAGVIGWLTSFVNEKGGVIGEDQGHGLHSRW